MQNIAWNRFKLTYAPDLVPTMGIGRRLSRRGPIVDFFQGYPTEVNMEFDLNPMAFELFDGFGLDIIHPA